MTTIPRRELVRLILETSPAEQVRDHFHVQDTTDLECRLNQFSRRELIWFLRHAGPNAVAALAMAEDNYALRAAPTLYLINALGRPALDELRARIEQAAELDRVGALLFQEDKPVRAVYVRRGTRLVLDNPPVYEFILSYERRIEYTNADPESANYGEAAVSWTLENAVCWFPEQDINGAIMSCTDSVAVNPVLAFLRSRIGLNCSVSDFTESMLQRLTVGSRPRSATFGSAGRSTGAMDVRTITVYDTDLENTSIFRTLNRELDRQQTSGYYTGHDGILVGGVGVTRRYARVWTPSHLDRRGLARLAISILMRTQHELALLKVEDPNAFVGYYTHHPIEVDNRSLEGSSRWAMDSLLRLILAARRNGGTAPAATYIQQLLENASDLKLEAAVIHDCPECGQRNAMCSHCGSFLLPRIQNGTVEAFCPACAFRMSLDTGYQCDCGQNVPVLQPWSNVFLFPSDSLTTALEGFLKLIDEDLPILFSVAHQELRLLPTRVREDGPILHLSDLDLWRTRAHIHVHEVARSASLVTAIGKTREKCVRDGRPTNKDRCQACLATTPARDQLASGHLCLLRVFGLPIQELFDGIHHRYEVADIRYQDSLGGLPVTVGIHVKSKASSNPPTGLGRKNRRIKELYTQVYFSLFQVATGQHAFDVLGIAIPNRISNEVLRSLEGVTRRFGVRLLVVDHDDWVRLFDLARDELA